MTDKKNIFDYLTDEDGSEEAFKKKIRDRVVASVSAQVNDMDTDSMMLASDSEDPDPEEEGNKEEEPDNTGEDDNGEE